MNNPSSKQIFSSVQRVKDAAFRAEEEYERKVNELQLKAGQSIDLFSGTAVSQVSDIVSNSVKICDELYAAYQVLVRELDGECRPLLEQQPEYSAVLSVRNLIHKLNEDSNIENNFATSLNNNNLGQVASRRYIPSVECKMIENYWDNRCESWPGKEEYEEIEQRIEDRIRQCENNIRKSNEELIAQYKKERDEWKKDCSRIKSVRVAEINSRLREMQSYYEKIAKQNYDNKCRESRMNIEKYTKIKDDAETALAGLGLFKGKEKKIQKDIIQEAVLIINKANAQIEAEQVQFQKEMTIAAEKAQLKRSSVSEQVEKAFPLPERPVVPSISGVENANNFYKEAIKEGMKHGVRYSVADLIENIPELADLSSVRVSSLLRRMEEDWEVSRVEENRKAFFVLPKK